MKYKRLICLTRILPLVVLCFLNFAFAETIILKSGEKIEGKIIEKTDDYIKIDLYGVPIPYYFEDIERIEETEDTKGEGLPQGITMEMLKKIEEYHNPAHKNIRELLQGPSIIESTSYDENGVLSSRQKVYTKDVSKRVRFELEDVKNKSKCIRIVNFGRVWTDCPQDISGRRILGRVGTQRAFIDSFYMLHRLSEIELDDIRKVEVAGVPYYFITSSPVEGKELNFYIDPPTYQCKKIELISQGTKTATLQIQATRLVDEGFRIPADVIVYYFRDGEKVVRRIKINMLWCKRRDPRRSALIHHKILWRTK